MGDAFAYEIKIHVGTIVTLYSDNTISYSYCRGVVSKSLVSSREISVIKLLRVASFIFDQA